MNQLESTAQLFKTLCEPVRLRILNLLIHSESEICVCDLMAVLEVPQSVVSRHLAYLRKSSLVFARREGVWMHYSMNPILETVAKEVLQVLRVQSATDNVLSQDLTRLMFNSCC